VFAKMKYCPNCNYGITELEFYSLKMDLSCPRCNGSNVSQFYSYGSEIHRQIWDGEYTQDKNRLNPLAFPKQANKQA